MKKIGYILSSFPVLSETFVSTEMRAMKASGHSIQPIAFHHHDGAYQQRDESLKAQTLYLCDYGSDIAIKALLGLRPSLVKGLAFAFKQQGLSLKSLLGNALKLAWLLRKNRCTHLHAHFALGSAAIAIVAARLCGISVSFVGHGFDIYANPQDLTLKLNSVDFAVAVCRDMEQHFQSLAPRANTALVYCGVETGRFSHTQEAAGHDAHADKKMLFIGRLCETKGLFTLLDAIRLLDKDSRPHIDMVGDGILREPLKTYVDEHGLSAHIHFLGAKQSSWFIDNAHHYSAMITPFELASDGDRDTGPVVVKEAMSLRLPVITTYFMGCKEMLTESCALRAQPKDPVDLAGVIQRFQAMSPEQIDNMVEDAHQRINTLYSAQTQAQSLSAMVEAT